MSGLIGKAMRFARSPQGKQTMSRAQRMLKQRQAGGKGKAKPTQGRRVGRRPGAR